MNHREPVGCGGLPHPTALNTASLLGKEVAIMQHFPLCKAISREFLQK